MDREMAQAWVDELESGKYPKGQHALCAGGTYCCLGVLAKMNGHLGDMPGTDLKIFRDGKAEVDDEGYYTNNQSAATGYLPDGYMGLSRYGVQDRLSRINDSSSESFDLVVAEIREMWLS